MEFDDYSVVNMGDKKLLLEGVSRTLDLIRFFEDMQNVANGDVDSLLEDDGNVADDPTEEVDMTGFRFGLVRAQLEKMFNGDHVLHQDGGVAVDCGDFAVVAEGDEAIQTGAIQVVEVKTGEVVSFAEGLDRFMPALHAARVSRLRMSA